MLATSDYGQELQEDLNAIVGYNEKFNNAIVRHALDTKNAGIMQNLNPLNATFCDVKKFDLQNPVLGKIATQVKASKFTDEQLTKKILMQDNIAKIKNRLEELKRPINFNDSDDETRSPGGGGGDDGAPPPLPPTSGRRSADSDAYGPLMRRLEELRHGLVPPSREAQQRDLRLAERKTELERLADRGVVKKRRSEEGIFRPVLPDMPPPTLIRDDFWPPPPVQPSDKSFIKPEASDTKRPLRDDFPRHLTKIIDSKKNKIEVILKKKKKTDINETNLPEQLSKLFPKLDEVINKKKDDEKNETKIEF